MEDAIAAVELAQRRDVLAVEAHEPVRIVLEDQEVVSPRQLENTLPPLE